MSVRQQAKDSKLVENTRHDIYDSGQLYWEKSKKSPAAQGHQWFGESVAERRTPPIARDYWFPESLIGSAIPV